MTNCGCEKTCSSKCDKTYDVIVVGAGTAGAVLASRLATQRPDLKVLTLEAGKNENDNPLVTGIFGTYSEEQNASTGNAVPYNPLTSDNIVSSKFQLETPSSNFLTSTYDKQVFTYSGGRGWGGASNHCYLFDVRTTPQFAEVMGVLGGVENGWTPDELNEINKSIEGVFYPFGGVPGPNRGTDGKWKVAAFPDPFLEPGLSFFQAFASESPVDVADNVPVGGDYNDNVDRIFSNQVNVFASPFFTRTHTGEAFLGPDVVDQETGKGVGNKLRVVNNAFVNRVLFNKNKKACGVEAIVNGKTKKYYARKKVILSAGSLRNPGILERSGVGNKDVLEKAGVKHLVYENNNVGENFKNHSGPALLVKVADPIPQNGAGGGVCFIKLLDEPTPTELETGVQQDRWVQTGFLKATGISLPGDPLLSKFIFDHTGLTDVDSVYTAIPFNLQPTSSGSIHIVTSSPLTNPMILTDINKTEIDKKVNREIYRYHKRVVDKANELNPTLGAELIYPIMTGFETDEDLDAQAAFATIVTQHSSGTCAMNKDATKGVVDGRLHVHGVSNLMVADNSIWTFVPPGNTAFPAALVGWKAADFVLSEL